nr:MAG TPA: hypothetical protein [Caudoviricetes sp.]
MYFTPFLPSIIPINQLFLPPSHNKILFAKALNDASLAS